MDYKLIWSPQAIEDIEAIAEYIARDSITYAESTVEQIFLAVLKVYALLRKDVLCPGNFVVSYPSVLLLFSSEDVRLWVGSTRMIFQTDTLCGLRT